jgi:KDO2-lipid IV(A) lauroyltransferase
MDIATYYLFRFFIFLFRIIPFPVLYVLSDLVYLLVYYLVGYRKKVVLKNLRDSFPERSEKEIRKIARGFYHHLADILIESLKAFTMKEEEVVKRYQYENTEFLKELYDRGQSVICLGGHYNNWEWGGIASGKQLAHRPVGFYKPLSNERIDAFVRKTRVQGRSVLVSILNTAAVFQADYGEPVIFYMVADQSPSSPRLAHWMRFLNQDTAVLHGPEKYARLHNLPVVYAGAEKIKRGHYRVKFSMLVEDPSKTAKGEISEIFMKTLEHEILKAPQYYLWSHRRWKLKR